MADNTESTLFENMFESIQGINKGEGAKVSARPCTYENLVQRAREVSYALLHQETLTVEEVNLLTTTLQFVKKD
jgi:hypothetical protein